jgi:cytidyltransferase-like protein
MKIVLVSGGFDPLHSGHIAYFIAAKQLGDKLIVGVNSDAWLNRKKGRYFMPIEERSAIISALSMVDGVVSFEGDYDEDNSCKKFVADTCANYSEHEIIFANGGDRSASNIQEMEVQAENLSFAFGVGGEDKKNSSSWILKEWKNPVVTRKWGKYTVLDKNGTWAVKELSFNVGASLSDQRHFKRNEHWHVVSGAIEMHLEHPDGKKEIVTCLAGHSVDIPVNTWHKAVNISNIESKVIEVWQGSELLEEDIERRS